MCSLLRGSPPPPFLFASSRREGGGGEATERYNVGSIDRAASWPSYYHNLLLNTNL